MIGGWQPAMVMPRNVSAPGEYEAGQTLEFRMARDADKIETMLQAVEYQAQGHDTSAWRETSATASGSWRRRSPQVTRTDGGPRSPRPTGNCAPAHEGGAARRSRRKPRGRPSPGSNPRSAPGLRAAARPRAAFRPSPGARPQAARPQAALPSRPAGTAPP